MQNFLISSQKYYQDKLPATETVRRRNRLLRDFEMRRGGRMEIKELEGAVTMENILAI